MIDLPPEREAAYALGWNLPRSELSATGQLEYNRLKAAWEQDAVRRAELARRHKANRSGTIHTL